MGGPVSRPSSESHVTLREITSDTVRIICDLAVHDDQKGFVAPNAVSIAQAHFSEFAWFRAIYAGETPVGFLMLYDGGDKPKPEYFLWRLMVDIRYQRLGLARKALDLLIEYVKTRPHATELATSIIEADGGPQPFYEKLGFSLTGEYEEGEAVMKLPLDGKGPTG